MVTVFVAIIIGLIVISITNFSNINTALSKSSHHSKSSTVTTNGVSSSGSGNSGSTIKDKTNHNC